GGDALELPDLLVPRAERAGGEVVPADLAEPQARRADRPLQVGDLEEDHFVAPRLEPPPQGREGVVVARRGETQAADAPASPLPPDRFLCPRRPVSPDELKFVHVRLSFA